jgi:hypothetical protein
MSVLASSRMSARRRGDRSDQSAQAQAAASAARRAVLASPLGRLVEVAGRAG